MKLRRRSPGALPETIVALIDVVFFLLVFFMVVGRMDANAPFEVAPPISLAGSEMPGGGTTVTVAFDGRMALDGIELAQSALLPQIERLRAADPDLFVRINAHRATELRHVLPLITALERLGVRDLVFVVTPDAE